MDKVEGPRIKFCGMTRPSDAAFAAQLGASYVGVIFAESPRQVTVQDARKVFEAAGPSTEHVAVFSRESPQDVSMKANDSGATIVQLHGDPESAVVPRIRREFSGKIWVVLSIDVNAETFLLPPRKDFWREADGLLLDARVGGRSGGTGKRFAWGMIAPAIRNFCESTELILAGGLNPENVTEAIQTVQPAVVDVSSGVEQFPGVKDPARMRAFAEAVRSASIVGRINTPRGTT